VARRIDIPLSDVQKALGGFLVLDHPACCSRCGALLADHYETHKLRLRIGPNRRGLYGQTYRINRPYHLRIRVCENCYKADFAVCPEEFDKDDTALGRLSRLHSRLFTLGAVIACVGLLLMTDIISSASALGGIKLYWPFITAPGGLLVLGTWMHQRLRQRRVLEDLDKAGIDPTRTPRSAVRTPVLEDDKDAATIPLQLMLKDEKWAEECANRYNWSTEIETKEID
jgi:hypothetical protein